MQFSISVVRMIEPDCIIIECATTTQRFNGSSVKIANFGSGQANLYAYAGNNPLTFYDLSGLIAMNLGVAGGYTFGGGIGFQGSGRV